MKNIKRLIRGKEQGFTILEVLIAIAITGILVTGIIMSLETSTKILMITNTQETAKDIAISDLEYIRVNRMQIAILHLQCPQIYKIFMYFCC